VYKDGRKKDGSKTQGNKLDKIKGSSGKENHQGWETREVGIKILRRLQKAMTPIPATIDQIRVEEEEEVTEAGDLKEGTL